MLIDVGVEDPMDERSPDSRATTSRSSAATPCGHSSSLRPAKNGLSLVVLVDVSTSMESRVKRSAIREEVERRLPLLLAPRDRVQAGAFAQQISISPPFAGNSKAFLTAVRKTLDPRDEETLGPSRLWDALDEAIKALVTSEGRRSVLVVTDGQATGNRDGPQEVAPRAVAAGVAVSVVGLDWERTIRQDAETGVRVRPGVALEWIAGATGGRYTGSADPSRARTRPRTPARRPPRTLHARLHAAIADGKMHDLEVRVRKSGVSFVRAFVSRAAEPRTVNLR